MKIVLTSLLLGVGLAAAGPALAADAVATGKPTQFAQQASQKAKQAKKNVRSNKGGAARGDTRSDQTKTMAKGKPQ
jgi:hypothetical protein